MPLIKVSSQDNKVSILILANDLSSLKQKGFIKQHVFRKLINNRLS